MSAALVKVTATVSPVVRMSIRVLLSAFTVLIAKLPVYYKLSGFVKVESWKLTFCRGEIEESVKELIIIKEVLIQVTWLILVLLVIGEKDIDVGVVIWVGKKR